MKLIKITIIIVCAFFIVGPTGGILEGSNQKETLRKDIKETEVAQELEEPDGVSLNFLPDGEWRIFARGTGVYDFDDEDDRQDAYREATLKAKANITKFLKEQITSEETLDNISKKMKKLEKKTGAGGASGSVSKETIKTSTEQIRVNASAVIRGVLVLETLKVPNSNGGGTIHITLGMSSKSARFAYKVGEQMENKRALSKPGAAGAKKQDKKERKKSKTEW